jgi:DNA-binding CsgD family transcriptional regulator
MTVMGDDDWPLTGRADELAAAVAAVRRVGRSAGVVVAGGAGVGATRLARETLAAVGKPVRWVGGSRSARSVPWGALAPLLGGEPPSITAAVAALAGTGGVVAVDDAHLLDDASAAAVRHVALLGRAAVVLTVRSGRDAPDAVTALWKDGTLPRIDLAALSADSGRTLVEAALGGLVDPLTAARLHALTRGNPQLLRQVVEDERARGRLRADAGVWRWRGRFVPSARLDELVAARIEPGVSAAERASLRRLRIAVACRWDAGPAGSAVDGSTAACRSDARSVGAAIEGSTAGPLDARPAGGGIEGSTVAAGAGIEGGAALDGALRAAVARLDVDAVDRLARRAQGPAAARARRWVAAARRGRLGPCAETGVGTALSAHDAGDALAGALAAALTGAPLGNAMARGRVAAARSVDTAWLREDLMGVAVLARRLAGQLDEAQPPEIEPDLGPSAAATRAVTAALLAVDRGQVATAVRDLQAVPIGPGEPWIGWCGWAAQRWIGLAQALAMTGDPAGARAALTANRAAESVSASGGVGCRPPSTGPVGVGSGAVGWAAPGAGSAPVPAWLRAQAMLAEAWVAAAEGALSEAVALARRAADRAATRGDVAVEVLARHTGVRFGDRAAADRLAALAADLDTPRAAISAAQAAALAHDDGAGLDAAAVRWAGVGAVALAADAAAQAAVAHRARGARGSALAAGARADRWAAGCAGLRTPALLAAARPLPLTDREREMTMLASTGLTNRAIAERLCVSVRTVEGHLYRACGKLAVPNRAALAAVLAGSALPA